MCLLQTANAQISFGLRGGMNFSSLPRNTYSLNDDDGTRITTLSDSYTGFHIGAMSQINLLAVFVMPEFLFVFSGNEMRLQRQGQEDEYYKQRFTQIDIPVMVGTKLGPLRAGLGPVASIILNSSSDMPDDAGYRERFNKATYGMQLGIGVNLGNLAFDLKYQFGLSKLGDGIELGNTTYDFDTRPRQTVFSIGLMF